MSDTPALSPRKLFAPAPDNADTELVADAATAVGKVLDKVPRPEAVVAEATPEPTDNASAVETMIPVGSAAGAEEVPTDDESASSSIASTVAAEEAPTDDESTADPNASPAVAEEVPTDNVSAVETIIPVASPAVAEEVPTDDECADGSPNVPVTADVAGDGGATELCAPVGADGSKAVKAATSRSPSPASSAESDPERTQPLEEARSSDMARSPESRESRERTLTPEPITRRRTRSESRAETCRPPAPKRSKAVAVSKSDGAADESAGRDADDAPVSV